MTFGKHNLTCLEELFDLFILNTWVAARVSKDVQEWEEIVEIRGEFTMEQLDNILFSSDLEFPKTRSEYFYEANSHLSWDLHRQYQQKLIKEFNIPIDMESYEDRCIVNERWERIARAWRPLFYIGHNYVEVVFDKEMNGYDLVSIGNEQTKNRHRLSDCLVLVSVPISERRACDIDPISRRFSTGEYNDIFTGTKKYVYLGGPFSLINCACNEHANIKCRFDMPGGLVYPTRTIAPGEKVRANFLSEETCEPLTRGFDAVCGCRNENGDVCQKVIFSSK